MILLYPCLKKMRIDDQVKGEERRLSGGHLLFALTFKVWINISCFHNYLVEVRGSPHNDEGLCCCNLATAADLLGFCHPHIPNCIHLSPPPFECVQDSCSTADAASASLAMSFAFCQCKASGHLKVDEIIGRCTHLWKQASSEDNTLLTQLPSSHCLSSRAHAILE